MVTGSEAQPYAGPAAERSDRTPQRGRGARLPWRWRNVSLLWRVFAANIVVCVAAFALLAWSPVTVHRVATPSELVILSIGLVLMLLVDLALLRRVFGPLRRLAALMARVDPLQPGRRAEPTARAGREVVALAEALNSMLDRLEDERRESGRRALAAQEGERLRIARELHDEVSQALTAVALRAERAAEVPAHQSEALSEIAQTVLRSLEDVHRIGRELRPEALDDLGLVNALIALCSRVSQQTGLVVRRDLSGRLPPLSSEVELVIYRVAQEALTNAIRHARASQVTVSLVGLDSKVVLRVADDGQGLGQEQRASESGLLGMRERAMLIGAELELRSARSDSAPAAGASSGRGTEVVLTVPAAAS